MARVNGGHLLGLAWLIILTGGSMALADAGPLREGDGTTRRACASRQRILYVTTFGYHKQLRERSLPYPGHERVLWESPDEFGTLSYFPSPSGKNVVGVWMPLPEGRTRAFTLDVVSGASDEIRVHGAVQLALWKGEHSLLLLTTEKPADGFELWTYDVVTNRPERLAEKTGVNEVLETAFSATTGAVAKAMGAAAKTVPARADDLQAAVWLSAGASAALVRPGRLPVGTRVAASPDGEYLAFSTGSDAVFVLDARSGDAVRVIPLRHLVDGEGVSVEQMRWAPDGSSLVFTESHYHPARFYAPDVGQGGMYPLDWTDLVRQYEVKDGRVATLVVGENAFVLP